MQRDMDKNSCSLHSYFILARATLEHSLFICLRFPKGQWKPYFYAWKRCSSASLFVFGWINDYEDSWSWGYKGWKLFDKLCISKALLISISLWVFSNELFLFTCFLVSNTFNGFGLWEILVLQSLKWGTEVTHL